MKTVELPSDWPLPQDQVPRLLVFLRHSGCPFCRQSLSDLKQVRPEIESLGTEIVVVHMIPDEEAAREFLEAYDLGDLKHIPDPDQELYRLFGIRQGAKSEYLGPRVWWKGLVCTLVEGHLPGKPQGDLSQLPGLVLLKGNEVLKEYEFKSSGDRPEYAKFVKEGIKGSHESTTR